MVKLIYIIIMHVGIRGQNMVKTIYIIIMNLGHHYYRSILVQLVLLIPIMMTYSTWVMFFFFIFYGW